MPSACLNRGGSEIFCKFRMRAARGPPNWPRLFKFMAKVAVIQHILRLAESISGHQCFTSFRCGLIKDAAQTAYPVPLANWWRRIGAIRSDIDLGTGKLWVRNMSRSYPHRDRPAGLRAALALVVLLAGCDGGGGNGGTGGVVTPGPSPTPTSTPAPAATVTLTVASATITPGTSTTLSWTSSAGATGCTASGAAERRPARKR